MRDVPNDPWGNPYHYRSPGQTNEIWSNGPDGKAGTLDDIQSWSLDKDRK
jgi:general secretion pathway protein G